MTEDEAFGEWERSRARDNAMETLTSWHEYAADIDGEMQHCSEALWWDDLPRELREKYIAKKLRPLMHGARRQFLAYGGDPADLEGL